MHWWRKWSTHGCSHSTGAKHSLTCTMECSVAISSPPHWVLALHGPFANWTNATSKLSMIKIGNYRALAVDSSMQVQPIVFKTHCSWDKQNETWSTKRNLVSKTSSKCLLGTLIIAKTRQPVTTKTKPIMPSCTRINLDQWVPLQQCARASVYDIKWHMMIGLFLYDYLVQRSLMLLQHGEIGAPNSHLKTSIFHSLFCCFFASELI